jgi:hypothetical protein
MSDARISPAIVAATAFGQSRAPAAVMPIAAAASPSPRRGGDTSTLLPFGL